MKFSIVTMFKGLAMGMAEVIPGVSGGTIAFITGIYERLLQSIKAFGPEAISAYRENGLSGVWEKINGPFLISLLLGMAIGLIIGVFVITHLIDNYPLLVWAFFFGLIIASAWFVGKQVDNWTLLRVVLLIIGAAFAYWITITAPAGGNTALWFVFLSGTLAISALMLPGISGGFILLLLGMYTYIVPTVKNLIKTQQMDSLLVVVVFGLGCLLGLVIFSRILTWTFKHYKNGTLAVLTGFLIGSLNKIWPWRKPLTGLTEDGQLVTWSKGMELDKVISEANLFPGQYEMAVGDPQTLGVILAILAGLAIVLALERFGPHEETS